MRTVLAFLLFVSLSSHASEIVCRDSQGNFAQLRISQDLRVVRWSEPWHSADSSGSFIGKELARYSPYRGYDRYRLNSFYSTPDSFYVLAIEPNRSNSFKAVVYFDNDDHAEEETRYVCQQK
jgi:hypothetical protein